MSKTLKKKNKWCSCTVNPQTSDGVVERSLCYASQRSWMQPLIGPQLVTDTLQCARFARRDAPGGRSSRFPCMRQRRLRTCGQSDPQNTRAQRFTGDRSRAEFRSCTHFCGGRLWMESKGNNIVISMFETVPTIAELLNLLWEKKNFVRGKGEMNDFGVYAVFGVNGPPQRLLG